MFPGDQFPDKGLFVLLYIYLYKECWFPRDEFPGDKIMSLSSQLGTNNAGVEQRDGNISSQY